MALRMFSRFLAVCFFAVYSAGIAETQSGDPSVTPSPDNRPTFNARQMKCTGKLTTLEIRMQKSFAVDPSEGVTDCDIIGGPCDAGATPADQRILDACKATKAEFEKSFKEYKKNCEKKVREGSQVKLPDNLNDLVSCKKEECPAGSTGCISAVNMKDETPKGPDNLNPFSGAFSVRDPESAPSQPQVFRCRKNGRTVQIKAQTSTKKHHCKADIYGKVDFLAKCPKCDATLAISGVEYTIPCDLYSVLNAPAKAAFEQHILHSCGSLADAESTQQCIDDYSKLIASVAPVPTSSASPSAAAESLQTTQTFGAASAAMSAVPQQSSSPYK
jgi:hypothetical protein